MMGAKNNVPAIRFEGFSGEWEEKALGEVAEFNPKAELPDIFEYVDLESVLGIELISHRTESKGSAPSRAQRLAYQGDVFYQTVRPYQKNNYLFYEPKNNYVFSTGYAQIRPQGDSYFLLSLVQNEKFIKTVLDNCTGTSYPAINSKDLSNIYEYYPHITEQTKIGNYFQQIDTLIAQHQQKHDKLLNLKKSLLEKMFPKQGATEPAIRFKGFSGAWEERKLLDNFDKIIDFRGRTPKKIGLDWSEKGYLALSALNVKNGYIDRNIDAHYGNQELYEKWMLGNELHKGQVLFTTEAPMGNVAQVPDEQKYILSQRTIAFEVTSELIKESFLAVLLGSASTFNKLTSLSSGGTAKGVSQKSMSAVDVFVSKELTEQTKIGNLFKQLDTLLNQHQAQLKKLNNIKQACLEKMFV